MGARTEIAVYLQGDAEFVSELRTLVELEGYAAAEYPGEADVILCRSVPSNITGEDARRFVAVGGEADYAELSRILAGYASGGGNGARSVPVVDRERRTVFFGGAYVRLTEREFRLFEVLYRSEGEPVSRGSLHREVWGGEGREQIVDVYVCYLREKLDGAFGAGHLRSVRGVGYKLCGF